VVRELARLTRDLLVLSIDSARVSDPEIAAESERQSMLDLSRRFSAEDLMRAFDVLTKAEFDIRGSMQPRYHLEMALLRWIHLRKLVPLTDLIKQLEGGARAPAVAASPARSMPSPGPAAAQKPTAPSAVQKLSALSAAASAKTSPAPATSREKSAPPAGAGASSELKPVEPSSVKASFLEEVRKAKKFFYNTVVAQAKIEFEGERVVFTFSPQQRALRAQLEQNRPFLEQTASHLAGRKMVVAAAEGPTAPSASPSGPRSGFVETPSPAAAGSVVSGDKKQELKDRALADSGVQTMLDVFAAEIKDVEEM
jgi:DNA polymerase-3 subunit gamma/tau